MHLRRISLQSASSTLCSNDRYCVFITASTNFKYSSASCTSYVCKYVGMYGRCMFLVFNYERKHSATIELMYMTDIPPLTAVSCILSAGHIKLKLL